MAKEGQPKLADRAELMLAYLCIRDVEGLPKQVAILDRFGLPSTQIALLCGVADGSVRNARMESKKEAPRQRGARVKGE